MERIKLDFSKTCGPIKPMNAVNNGPTNPGVRKSKTNFDAYKAAKFPFARNHDASFYVLSEEKSNELYKEKVYNGNSFEISFDAELYSVYLIKFTKA